MCDRMQLVSFTIEMSFNRYRNGCRIRPSSNLHKYFDRDGNASLALATNDSDDDLAGHYTCTASNEGGENTINVTVEAQQGEEEK